MDCPYCEFYFDDDSNTELESGDRFNCPSCGKLLEVDVEYLSNDAGWLTQLLPVRGE